MTKPPFDRVWTTVSITFSLLVVFIETTFMSRYYNLIWYNPGRRRLTMIKPIIKATSSSPLSKEEAEQLKFSLYLKNRKVVGISKVMDDVLLWPKANIDDWAKRFSPEVSDLLDEMLDDAVSIFDGTTLDKELMGLFAEFTENLKIVTQQVQGVIITNQPIDA